MIVSATPAKHEDRHSLEDTEVADLLQKTYDHYGVDFRNYSLASIKRRIRAVVKKEKLKDIPELQKKILDDAACMQRFLVALSIHATSLFRDPPFYVAFRERVIPLLKTYPFIRIWHAGCSSGQEVYSMAILLKEEGLYERTKIYATDLSERILDRAKSGIFSLASMQEYTNNYFKAGGKSSLSEYYFVKYNAAIFNSGLKKNIVFAQHNLVTDGSFNEFHVIFCRNVMIYFNPILQEHCHHLLFKSLLRLGFLGLGNKENILFSPHESNYVEYENVEKLYRKVTG